MLVVIENRVRGLIGDQRLFRDGVLVCKLHFTTALKADTAGVIMGSWFFWGLHVRSAEDAEISHISSTASEEAHDPL